MEANADSQQSFLNATGFAMNDVMLLIASIVCALIFLWSSWVALSHYEQWAQNRNNVTLFDVMWGITRSIILLSVVIFIVS